MLNRLSVLPLCLLCFLGASYGQKYASLDPTVRDARVRAEQAAIDADKQQREAVARERDARDRAEAAARAGSADAAAREREAKEATRSREAAVREAREAVFARDRERERDHVRRDPNDNHPSLEPARDRDPAKREASSGGHNDRDTPTRDRDSGNRDAKSGGHDDKDSVSRDHDRVREQRDSRNN